MNFKKILFIIGGGISAYKSLDLIRELKTNGFEITPVITKSGLKFVTPLSVSTLSESKVYTDLFDFEKESQISHIKLARECDLLLVVPSTADLIAKFANGFADDLATTIFLSSYSKKIIVPAMNVAMWENKSTQRNVKKLVKDGISIVGPDKGKMACGEYGYGRMSENERILNFVLDVSINKVLKGKNILITSGPTIEPIDPIRYITNRSTGIQGYKITECLHDFGAEVTLISGPTNVEKPRCKNFFQVQTAEEMFKAIPKDLKYDVAICVAAVSDWKVDNVRKNKIKKEKKELFNLEFKENIDILKEISNFKNRPKLVIGFAAETQEIEKNAQEKLISKGCDWIIANDVRYQEGFMGKDENEIKIFSKGKVEKISKSSKTQIAQILSQKIVNELV